MKWTTVFQWIMLALASGLASILLVVVLAWLLRRQRTGRGELIDEKIGRMKEMPKDPGKGAAGVSKWEPISIPPGMLKRDTSPKCSICGADLDEDDSCPQHGGSSEPYF